MEELNAELNEEINEIKLGVNEVDLHRTDLDDAELEATEPEALEMLEVLETLERKGLYWDAAPLPTSSAATAPCVKMWKTEECNSECKTRNRESVIRVT